MRRFVGHKNFSNFLGTVPSFGFKISIIENVRSQNFIKNWLSEVQKFYRISLIFEWPMYMYYSINSTYVLLCLGCTPNACKYAAGVWTTRSPSRAAAHTSTARIQDLQQSSNFLLFSCIVYFVYFTNYFRLCIFV